MLPHNKNGMLKVYSVKLSFSSVIVWEIRDIVCSLSAYVLVSVEAKPRVDSAGRVAHGSDMRDTVSH